MSTPIPNPLDRYPAVRAALYMVQWIFNGITVVLSAVFTFTTGMPDDWPRWFLGILAVAPVIWTYLGLTAQANVWNPPPADTPHEAEDFPEDDRGAGELDLILKVAAAAALILVCIVLLARLL